jgi:hypothetical protein
VESGEANVQMLLPVVHQPWSFSFPKFSSSRFHPLSYLSPVFPSVLSVPSVRCAVRSRAEPLRAFA